MTSPFIPADQTITWERVDQGQDLRSTPGGFVVAPWAGTVKLANPDPGGFGTHYALYTPSAGPHKGLTFYIGHAWALLTGSVKQGQAISKLGTGSEAWMGNAKGIPGHTEIGVWGPNGPGSMQAGYAVAPIVKGAASADTATVTGGSSSTSTGDSSGGPSFFTDPAGAIVFGLVKPIEDNALRMLLYGVLVLGAVGLITAGSLRLTHEEVS